MDQQRNARNRRQFGGTFNITNGGAVSNTGVAYIGYSASFSAISAVTVDGANSKWTNGSDLYLGYNQEGTLSITNGGAVSNVNAYISGFYPYYSSTATVDGANSTWTCQASLYVGRANGNGTLNVTNGGVVCTNSVVLGQNVGSAGTVSFSGGTLKAYNAANASWISFGAGTGTVNVGQGGAKFDTNGFNMGIGVVLRRRRSSPDGGITKLGAGTLTLTGANSYTGLTTVRAGTLELGVNAQSPVLTGGGASLGHGLLVFDYTGGTGSALATCFGRTRVRGRRSPARTSAPASTSGSTSTTWSIR